MSQYLLSTYIAGTIIVPLHVLPIFIAPAALQGGGHYCAYFIAEGQGTKRVTFALV